MNSDWHYRAFDLDEHRGRFERAQASMRESGLAACICNSPELIYYFSGYEAHTHHAIGSQAIVLPVDGDQPIVILRDGDIPQAEVTDAHPIDEYVEIEDMLTATRVYFDTLLRLSS